MNNPLLKLRQGILEEMTIEEVGDFDPEVVVIPVGSTEPHGPYLPYAADTLQARAVAEMATIKAGQKGARALCFPTLPISLNTNNQFPFALSLSVSTFMQMLKELCEQIEREGVRRIVIANYHGGNSSVIAAFLRDWASRKLKGSGDDNAFVCSVECYNWKETEALVQYPSDHAGEAEVLQILAIAPHLVRREKLARFEEGQPAVKLLSRGNVMWVKPWHLHAPASALGDTQTADDPDRGKELLQTNADLLADLLIELCQLPWSELFPYPEA